MATATATRVSGVIRYSWNDWRYGDLRCAELYFDGDVSEAEYNAKGYDGLYRRAWRLVMEETCGEATVDHFDVYRAGWHPGGVPCGDIRTV